MSLFTKVKDFFCKDFAGQCNGCVHTSTCLCFKCENEDCRDGGECTKIKPITYCECKICDKYSCRYCKPDVY